MKMLRLWGTAAILLAAPAVLPAAKLPAANETQNGRPALVELTVGSTVHEGKVLARDARHCWLMDRAGALHRLALGEVESFRRVSPEFRPYAGHMLRKQLEQEFGREFETAQSRHYVVCAPPGRARNMAELFESTWRTFHLYFAVRGFDVPDPEFPLVAVMFPDRESFLEYCRRENVSATNFVGVYLSLSNRVVLYDPKGSPGADSGRIAGDLHDTIVHEATHQIAYNTGLHDRLGSNPRWVAEGLATVFEAPGVRDAQKHRSAESRINRGRFVEFRDYQSRRPDKSLAAFVSSDDMYQSSPSDAYAQGWALTFYLIETRPREYAAYLKTIAARDRLTNYGSEERLADFRRAFGGHLELLEADFLRFMLKVDGR